ncbi:MAG: hypothetical protein JKX72_11625 [Robiginitomaculum sp.]|nr:hypothetical protein [Robiginitomaculum sp.]
MYFDKERLENDNLELLNSIEKISAQMGALATSEEIAQYTTVAVERRSEQRVTDNDAVNNIINEAYNAPPEDDGEVAPVLRDTYARIDRMFRDALPDDGTNSYNSDHPSKPEELRRPSNSSGD